MHLFRALQLSLLAFHTAHAAMPQLDSDLQHLLISTERVAKLSIGAENTTPYIRVIAEPAPEKAAADIDEDAIANLGARIVARSRTLLQVEVAADQLLALTRIAGISFVRRPLQPHAAEQHSAEVILSGAATYHDSEYQGQGVDVAIIDSGFRDAGTLGRELPTDVHLVDFRSNTGEDHPHGSGCAELVHDMAPEAKLHLLQVSNLLEMENALDYCIREGIDIISSSVSWFGTGYGDGQGRACAIADRAAEHGILWINSAGNYANKQYEGTWRDSDGDGYHNFSATSNVLLLASSTQAIQIYMTWNDWPTTYQDYDLYLVEIRNGQERIVAESAGQQAGSRPYEKLHLANPQTGSVRYGVKVSKKTQARSMSFKILSTEHDVLQYGSKRGTISSPADARGSLSVGAIDRNERIRYYSSQGPTADGRNKPELVALDGVRTASYGYRDFYGTSASAPHVAGAAAVLKSRYPHYTREDLVHALTTGAIDRGTRGADNTYGYGRLKLAKPRPPQRISLGQTRRGSIYPIGEVDEYTFEGTRGQQVHIDLKYRRILRPKRLSTGNAKSFIEPNQWNVELYRDGQLVALAPGDHTLDERMSQVTSRHALALPESGRYTVRIYLRDFTESYSLTVDQEKPNLDVDFDGDGEVTMSDYWLFLRHYGKQTARYDLDDDGWVGYDDYLLFLTAFDAQARAKLVQLAPEQLILQPRLLPNAPNPFNSSTLIRYEARAGETVQLTIYNVLGQKVRTIDEGIARGGAHSVQWDGRDAQGRDLASGLYIARLQAGQHVAHQKMTLLR